MGRDRDREIVSDNKSVRIVGLHNRHRQKRERKKERKREREREREW